MWADGFTGYLRSYEVRLHRRTNTFGGVVWTPGAPGLITEERQLEIAVQATKRRKTA
jgi:hypothetical protein